MARYAERLRSGSRCTILALDQTGERVVSIVAPRRQDAAVAATGRRIDALPRPFAGCLRSGLPALHPAPDGALWIAPLLARSEEHTSELQSLMRISYAVFCLKKTI